MTIEEMQEMIIKLQTELQLKIEEKNNEDAKIEAEKMKELSHKNPAYAETRARLHQVLRSYSVQFSEQDVKYILQPCFNIENVLRKKDPKYRYKPQSSAFLGQRKPGQTNYNHVKKNKNNTQTEMEIK